MAVSLHGNNGLVTTNGTAAAPSLAAPDTDTGLYFGTNLIYASTAGSERLRITSDGKIGINASATNNRVEIIQDPLGFPDDSAQPQATILVKHGISGTNRRWVGIGASSTGAWIQSSSPGGTGLSAPLNINPGGGDVLIPNKLIHYGDTDTFLEFGTDTITLETAGAERLRIRNTGEVGINCASPTRPLHIIGNDGSSGATSGNSDTTVILENAGGNGSMIEFLNANTGAGHLMFTDPDGSNRGRISYHHNGDYFRVDTSGSEKVRITSGVVASFGNSSPPAWANDTGYYNIQLGKTGFLRSDTDTTNTFMTIGQNAYKDSGGWKYGVTAGASSIFQQGGNIIFETAASGTAGNALTLTQKLRIASDSNITQTIDSDGDGFIITAGDMKPMLTGNSNRSAHNNTIFGISGKWNNTEIGRIAFEAGPDTTNKDDGKIRFYTRPSGGSLTKRFEIVDDGKITVAANSDIRFTNGTWTGEYAGKIQHNSNNLYIQGGTGGIRFRHASNGSNQFSMTNGGNFEITNGDLVVASGHGIDFSATGDGNGTDSSELLDDYEEGTWSPTIYGGTTAGSYSYQANRTGGKYTKIGNLVYIEGVLRIETINSAGAGDLYMGGMPYSTSGPMASAWTIGKGVQFFMYGTSGNGTASIAEPPFVGTASGGASAFNIRSYGKNLNVMPQIEDFDNQWWIFQVAGWYPVS